MSDHDYDRLADRRRDLLSEALNLVHIVRALQSATADDPTLDAFHRILEASLQRLRETARLVTTSK